MQLMPSVGRQLAAQTGIAWQGKDPLFDPVTNIRLGTLYLFKQIIQFRDVRKGIMAYNLGEDRLRGRLRENEPLPRQYFHSVWENYHMLKDRYES
jgi:peptidoglycan lytic transglycosylase